MTAAEWEQCTDLVRMLEDLPGPIRRGKLLLFAVGSSRRLGDDLRRASAWRLLEAAEGLADGSITASAFGDVLTTATAEHSSGNNQLKGRNHPDRGGLMVIELLRALAGRAPDANATGLPPRGKRAVRAALEELQNQLAHVHKTGTTFGSFDDAKTKELKYLAGALRDVVGPAYQPVVFRPEWLTPTVTGLATGINSEQAFDRMPILADALQDAGCEDRQVLEHCLGPGPHVRGCWVLWELLGKGE